MLLPSSRFLPVLLFAAGSAAETPVNSDELFLPAAETIPAAAPPPLIAHLTFDDPGDLNADASGQKNAPSTGGRPSAAPGVFGGAAVFDENDHFVWQGEHSPLVRALEGSFTVCVWIRTTQKIAGDGNETWDGAGIVWADFAGYRPPKGDTIPLALTGSKAAAFISGGRTIHSTSAINTGEWVHLAFVRGARNRGGYSKLYVNGKLEATGGGDARPLSDARRLAIGGNLLDRRHFNGLMDDLRIYQTDLSESGIVTLSMIALAESKLSQPLRAKVRELEDRFEADRAGKVEAAYRQGIGDLRIKYLAALERASESAIKTRDLQAAVVFQREIKDLENGAALRAEDGPGAPPALLAMRKTYREAIPAVAALRIKHLESLLKRQDAALAQLQENGKPGEAAALKAYRTLCAARQAPPLPVAPESPEPDTRTPSASAFGTPVKP